MGRTLSKLCVKKVRVPVTEPSPEKMTDMESVPTQFDENQTTLQPNRDFHTNECSSYWLPKDEEEQLRLTGVSKR